MSKLVCDNCRNSAPRYTVETPNATLGFCSYACGFNFWKVGVEQP